MRHDDSTPLDPLAEIMEISFLLDKLIDQIVDEVGTVTASRMSSIPKLYTASVKIRELQRECSNRIVRDVQQDAADSHAAVLEFMTTLSKKEDADPPS